MIDNIKKRWSGSGDLKTATTRQRHDLQAVGGRVGEGPFNSSRLKGGILVLLAVAWLSGCETLKTYDVHAQGDLQRRQETRVITIYTPHGVQTCIIQGDTQMLIPARCCPGDRCSHSRP